ncbi:hypothetical protein [Tsukamurella pulmonis]|uniref:hypothetical protein n=1 Tax=Tsukamurella pulmonis TaxID=47312 RepID=UPI0010586A2C|nr:hypothetical protein [Tsukamurella pulmonis]
MYFEHFPDRGRPPGRKRNLQDLLRITLGAVELTSTRREVLDSSANNSSNLLPKNLQKSQHAIYETTVVYEFSQLARSDFEAHNNAFVWERPIVWTVPGGKNLRSGNIDLALFSQSRDTETRIEFGKAGGSSGSTRDPKLEEDAEKLLQASKDFRASKSESAPGIGMGTVENYVILWNQSKIKLTKKKMNEWDARCDSHALQASKKLSATIVLECSAAVSLSTFENGKHRTAYAAIYAVTPADQSGPEG